MGQAVRTILDIRYRFLSLTASFSCSNKPMFQYVQTRKFIWSLSCIPQLIRSPSYRHQSLYVSRDQGFPHRVPSSTSNLAQSLKILICLLRARIMSSRLLELKEGPSHTPEADTLMPCKTRILSMLNTPTLTPHPHYCIKTGKTTHVLPSGQTLVRPSPLNFGPFGPAVYYWSFISPNAPNSQLQMFRSCQVTKGL
jgi:hypothetical protein